MSDELKPCPWEKPGEQHDLEMVDVGALMWVRCATCMAAGPCEDSREEAAAAWNARTERTCGEYRGDVYETPDGKSDDIELWCENCDIPLEDGWRHCPNCGARIEVMKG